MLTLLSPAKTLDMDTPSRVQTTTQPQMLEQSAGLVKTLRGYSKVRLGKLMKISPALADVNKARYQSWQLPFDQANARPSIQAFRGDVYIGLDADTLNGHDLRFAQNHLRILSGLYGVLRPLDLMQAYRLEMGTSLKTSRGSNLYSFWGDTITESLNADIANKRHKAVVNLASNEYFSAVKPGHLTAPLVSPVFLDEKNGEYKIISFFAKKARGAMARHLIQGRAKRLTDLAGFNGLGYAYAKGQSTDERPVFTRSAKAAQQAAEVAAA